MNFDDEDDSDFSFSPQANNKLASLFKGGLEESSDETLKYKAPKQPQQTPQPTSSGQASSSVLFFSAIQAFKYLNNRYEPQGKLGLALLSNQVNNQNQYKILMYVTRTQPVATIRIGIDFKVSIQKNNYVSFYDESKQLWSILFDTEELVANFATQILLTKCNLLNGNIENYKLQQDLKVHDNDANLTIEPNDFVEVSTVVSLWKDMKLNEIDNTIQKPFKLKLGKNKLPQAIEDLIIKSKQGDRKLFVLTGNNVKSFYPNNVAANSVVFYDINILRVKKNTGKEERSNSNAEQMPPLPQLNLASDQDSRSRSDSVKEKTKILNDQMNDPKIEKAKVISRMAKLGQQMLPSGANASSNLEVEDEWAGSGNNDLNVNLQQNQQQTQFMTDMQAQSSAQLAAKQALLMQNQQLQQQIALQNQLIQAQAQAQTQSQMQSQPQIPGGQLALYKSPNQQMYMYPQQGNLVDQSINQPVMHTILQQQQPQLQQQQPIQPQHNQSELPSSVLTKLELITEKLDQIKSITHSNNQNMPNMETSVILQNIQRIVKENEQYKKELYEKSSKIEEQNSKITELLMKAQNYVEQSHQILELKNNSYQSTAEKSQYRILELEQDKMKLTNELTQLTSQISELNLEVNRLKKEDVEMRKQLNDVSKNTDQYKQNSDRLLVENADLQTKLDAVLSEIKKERHLRKTNETKLQLNEEELIELKANLSNSQKLIEEKKRKLDLDRVQFDSEIEDLKRLHLNEINLLKEKLNKAKANANESQSEQIKQIEADLNREWQSKLEKSIQQTEQKYERKLSELKEEKLILKKQLDENNEIVKNLRINLTTVQNDSEKLKQNLEDFKVYKDKYERLHSQTLIMKERYENRIKELIDAEPDSEVIGEEVKKLMNAMYKKLKSQIRPDQYYSGNGILIAMLRIIKMITLQLLSAKGDSENQNEEEDVDYFSQHIYKAPEITTVTQSVSVQQTITEPPVNPPQINPSTQVSTNQENSVNEKSPSLSAIGKLAIISQSLVEEIKQDEKESDKKETNVELKQDNLEDKEVSEKVIEDDDDDIQLINDDEKNEFMVNETLSQSKILSKSSEELNQEEVSNQQEQANEPEDKEIKESNETEKLNDSDDNIIIINNEDLEKQESLFSEAQVISRTNDLEQENKIEETEKVEDKKEDEEIKEIVEKNVEESEKEDQQNKEDEEQKEKETASSKVEIKKPIISKGLFDDDEDDENDENDQLFSFTSKSTKTNELEKEPLKADLSNDNKTSSTNLNSTTTPLNLKFSPPPLFDDDDDSNDKDIDWFK